MDEGRQTMDANGRKSSIMNYKPVVNRLLRRRDSMKFRNVPSGLVLILALSAALAMCGKDITGSKGGNDGGNNGITGTPAVSWGVMQKGSVIVNGVTFDDASAQITHDNSPAGSDLLREG